MNNIQKVNNMKHILKNVFYINLDNRTDRRHHCEILLNDLNCTYERFSAIKQDNGSLGCAMSHLKVLEIAKERALDYVIIFEDDFKITNKDTFISSLNNFFINPPEFDVLKFGGNALPPYKINKTYVKLTYSYCTMSYMVKKHYYTKLINNYKQSIYLLKKYGTGINGIYCCDVWQNILQKNDTWLLLQPLCISQLETYSDIEKKFISYDNKCLNLKNSEVKHISNTHLKKFGFDSMIEKNYWEKISEKMISVLKYHYDKNESDLLKLCL